MRVMWFGMRWRCFGLVLVVAGLGCTKKNPILICHDGQCTDAQYRYCDLDGAIGGEPNTCVKPSCTANEFVTCDGSNAITCNSDATDYLSMACQFGCSATNGGCNQCAASSSTCSGSAVATCDASGVVHTEQCAGSCVDAPTPHCQYLSPKYLPDICETPGVGTFTWAQQFGDFDSDLDVNCNGGIVQQTGAPAICVVRYASITIVAGTTLHVFSSANLANYFGDGRAIAFVSDGDLNVGGTINVSASRLFSGPGGGYEFSGGGGGGSGGGGAGFATAGASGGSTGSDGGANNGGFARMDPVNLETLAGGPQSDGGGGGALLLVSCHGSVNVSGLLLAGGGGGVGGYYVLDGTGGGAGGGAGGNIVLEGLDVHVTGSVLANGGGGGAGGIGSAGSSTSEDGRDGTIDYLSGPPGGIARAGAGNGGAGGSLSGPPQPGRQPTGSGGPGGGGGSMGFAQTYTPAGVTPTLTPVAMSPAFGSNATVPTR